MPDAKPLPILVFVSKTKVSSTAYKALPSVTSDVDTICLTVNVIATSCTVEVAVTISPSVNVNAVFNESGLSSNSTIDVAASEKAVAEAITAVAPEELPVIFVPITSEPIALPIGVTLIIVLLDQLPAEALIINLFG